jgi:hypothetical protein
MRVKLYVNEGRVNCPRRGEIDVDTCFSCGALRDVRKGRGGAEVLECDPPIGERERPSLYVHW